MSRGLETSLISASEGLKCTVVSIVPFEIVEAKPGLTPPVFIIPAAKNGEPELLHIGTCFHYVYIDETRGSLQVRDSPEEVARSICYDYASSQVGVYRGAAPGIFWVPGQVSVDEVKQNHAVLLHQARIQQNRWFEKLIELADKYWARYGSKMAICDFMRDAAKSMKVDPARHLWMSELTVENAVDCPACGNLVKPGVIVCPACKCILDAEKYKTLQFA